MELANIILYLGAGLVIINYALNSNVENSTHSRRYWSSAAYLMSLSCFSFATFPLVGMAALTIGSVSQMASDIALALLFRSLHTTIKKSLLRLSLVALLVICIAFGLVLIYRSFGGRFAFISSITVIVSLWQLYEIRSLYKKEASYHVAIMFLAITLQIALLTYRTWTNYQDDGTHTTIFDEDLPEFIARFLTVFSYTAIFISIGNYFYQKLWEREHKHVLNKENQLLDILNSLASAKDDDTGVHIIRTQSYVRALANRLKLTGHYLDQLSERDIDNLFKAAPLHDIGKMAIPDHILKNPGKLTEDEWDVMKTHAAAGAEILISAKIKFDDDDDDVLNTAIKIAGAHHEKWDGTGYPNGLKADDIPLAARIMSLADVYDALTCERPYKVAWTHEQAVQEIVRMKGIAFDPIIVEAFLLEESHFKQIADDFRKDSSQ